MLTNLSLTITTNNNPITTVPKNTVYINIQSYINKALVTDSIISTEYNEYIEDIYWVVIEGVLGDEKLWLDIGFV